MGKAEKEKVKLGTELGILEGEAAIWKTEGDLKVGSVLLEERRGEPEKRIGYLEDVSGEIGDVSDNIGKRIVNPEDESDDLEERSDDLDVEIANRDLICY